MNQPIYIILFLSVSKIKYQEKSQISFSKSNIEKQMVPRESTAKVVSFEWAHHRIFSLDLTVRTALHVSIINSGSERVSCGVKLRVSYCNKSQAWLPQP